MKRRLLKAGALVLLLVAVVCGGCATHTHAYSFAGGGAGGEGLLETRYYAVVFDRTGLDGIDFYARMPDGHILHSREVSTESLLPYAQQPPTLKGPGTLFVEYPAGHIWAALKDGQVEEVGFVRFAWPALGDGPSLGRTPDQLKSLPLRREELAGIVGAPTAEETYPKPVP